MHDLEQARPVPWRGDGRAEHRSENSTQALRNSTTGGDYCQGEPVRNGAGQVVGKIMDGWLEKRNLDYQRHHLHKYKAWATDADHVQLLRQERGQGVRLVLIDGRILEAKLADFEAHAYPIEHGIFGKQLVLPDAYWQTVRTRDGQQLGFDLAGVV